MTGTSHVSESEEAIVQAHPQHFSHSRINHYLTFLEQCRLRYIERLLPTIERAALVFGTLVHSALADFLWSANDPLEVFLQAWNSLKEVEFPYGERESWQDPREKGEELLRKSFGEEARKIRQMHSVGERFALTITSIWL